MKEFELFKIMYVILDALHDENKNNLLEMYLSEINPFVWKNTSGDPYYFNKFKNYIEKYGDADYGYDAILKYLEAEDYYKGIDLIFKKLEKKDYLLNAKEIIKDNPNEFKYYKVS